MVELDVEDERFTNGTGGYTMPLKTEEVTSDAEESTTSAHDSEYEGMSGSEAGFKVGSSVVSDDEGGTDGADEFRRALQTICDTGGAETMSVEDAFDKVFVNGAGKEYFLHTSEHGQVLIDANLVVHYVDSHMEVFVVFYLIRTVPLSNERFVRVLKLISVGVWNHANGGIEYYDDLGGYPRETKEYYDPDEALDNLMQIWDMEHSGNEMMCYRPEGRW